MEINSTGKGGVAEGGGDRLGVGLGEGVARYRHPISRGVRFRGAPIRRRASLPPLCKTEADANLCSPDLGPGFLRSGIAEGAFVRSGASAALVGLWVAGDPIPVDAGLTESGETLCQTGIDTNPYSFIIESSFPPPERVPRKPPPRPAGPPATSASALPGGSTWPLPILAQQRQGRRLAQNDG